MLLEKIQCKKKKGKANHGRRDIMFYLQSEKVRREI
jgi:hypothetical protein